MKVAILYFPGMNCEEETKLALESVGLQAEIVLWNESVDLSQFAAFILPGGWSYEDRIRAGVIASRHRLLTQLKQEAANGKPVLGICNGAQILIESGMVPDLGVEEVEFALAPNKNPFVSGYYCSWVHVKSVNDCVFVKRGQVLPLPIAHGEGRFVTSNVDVLKRVDPQIVLQYCTDKGEIKSNFPTNPNGALHNIAALCNKNGNVLAMMPHPERANWLRQVPGNNQAAPHVPGPGRVIFENLRRYLESQ